MKTKLTLGIAVAAVIATVVLVFRTTACPQVFRGELRFTCVYESEGTNSVVKKVLAPELRDGKNTSGEYALQAIESLNASDEVKSGAKRAFAKKYNLVELSKDGESAFNSISFEGIISFENLSYDPVFQISATAKDRQTVDDVLRSWFEVMKSENDRRRMEQYKCSMENLLGWVQKFKHDIAAMDDEIRSLKDGGASVPSDLQYDRKEAGNVLRSLECDIKNLESSTNLYWQIKFLSLNVIEVE